MYSSFMEECLSFKVVGGLALGLALSKSIIRFDRKKGFVAPVSFPCRQMANESVYFTFNGKARPSYKLQRLPIICDLSTGNDLRSEYRISSIARESSLGSCVYVDFNSCFCWERQ